MKIILVRNSVKIKDKDYSFYMYNYEYRYLILIWKTDLKIEEDENNYHENEDCTIITEQTLESLIYVKAFSNLFRLEPNFENFNVIHQIEDQNRATFHFYENFIVPVYKFRNSAEIEKYKKFPKLHFCTCHYGGRSYNTEYTFYPINDITCLNTKKVYHDQSLEICNFCEPNNYYKELLKSGIAFHTSNFFYNISNENLR
ncbi:hypothetical protein C7S20_16800 [Christiangramia fulva]|uniref:Uncharacterized protein n=1 Tax=Christiangramia fulva TaxID=2126553 RepID=A0A2R3Z937_9FLAO|nr:hypothetical protein [Christiangramia fulva]AVR46787.1 hypothetical protein C7S20_16800 [Christiangramia fulva]